MSSGSCLIVRGIFETKEKVPKVRVGRKLIGNGRWRDNEEAKCRCYFEVVLIWKLVSEPLSEVGPVINHMPVTLFSLRK